MKKTERIQSVVNALARIQANVATVEMIAKEVALGITGTITPNESKNLVESQKWTAELADLAYSAGLVVEKTKAKKEVKAGVGKLQKKFAEQYPDLYNGKRKPAEEDLKLIDDIVEEFGVYAVLSHIRAVVANKTEYQIGQCFLLKEKTKK